MSALRSLQVSESLPGGGFRREGSLGAVLAVAADDVVCQPKQFLVDTAANLLDLAIPKQPALQTADPVAIFKDPIAPQCVEKEWNGVVGPAWHHFFSA